MNMCIAPHYSGPFTWKQARSCHHVLFPLRQRIAKDSQNGRWIDQLRHLTSHTIFCFVNGYAHTDVYLGLWSRPFIATRVPGHIEHMRAPVERYLSIHILYIYIYTVDYTKIEWKLWSVIIKSLVIIILNVLLTSLILKAFIIHNKIMMV
jgi:hypothetical protein